jgi:hypothetical protein
MSDVFLESLRNRVRAMNSLWERAAADMTLAQVNHQERAGVLPIAFSLNHFIRAQDQSISRPFLGEAPLWEQGGWAAKVGVNVDKFGLGETVEEMEALRFADLDAWRAYQTDVISRTSRVVAGVTEADLLQVLAPKLPPSLEDSFCAAVIGREAPLRKLEVIECFIYQHGLRHMGEIEHARALVGLGGLTA